DALSGLVHDLDAAERRLEPLREPELHLRRSRSDRGAHARLGAIEERVRPRPGRRREEGGREEEQREGSAHQLPTCGRGLRTLRPAGSCEWSALYPNNARRSTPVPPSCTLARCWH